MLFYQIFPPSPSLTESIRLFYTSVSRLYLLIQNCRLPGIIAVYFEDINAIPLSFVFHYFCWEIIVNLTNSPIQAVWWVLFVCFLYFPDFSSSYFRLDFYQSYFPFYSSSESNMLLHSLYEFLISVFFFLSYILFIYYFGFVFFLNSLLVI